MPPVGIFERLFVEGHLFFGRKVVRIDGFFRFVGFRLFFGFVSGWITHGWNPVAWVTSFPPLKDHSDVDLEGLIGGNRSNEGGHQIDDVIHVVKISHLHDGVHVAKR